MKDSYALDPEAFKKKLDEEEVTLLDVRTPEEFEEEHIKGAFLLDFYSSSFRETLESFDKERTYLIYCHTGGRSFQTLIFLTAQEYPSVFHLEGGIEAWKAKGYEVVSEK